MRACSCAHTYTRAHAQSTWTHTTPTHATPTRSCTHMPHTGHTTSLTHHHTDTRIYGRAPHTHTHTHTNTEPPTRRPERVSPSPGGCKTQLCCRRRKALPSGLLYFPPYCQGLTAGWRSCEGGVCTVSHGQLRPLARAHTHAHTLRMGERVPVLPDCCVCIQDG